MKALVLVAALFTSSFAFADDTNASSKMSEVDYLKLQVVELQSRLDEAVARVMTCERTQAEVERNKTRETIAKAYKIGPTDEIKPNGVIVRKEAKTKSVNR